MLFSLSSKFAGENFVQMRFLSARFKQKTYQHLAIEAKTYC